MAKLGDLLDLAANCMLSRNCDVRIEGNDIVIVDNDTGIELERWTLYDE